MSDTRAVDNGHEIVEVGGGVAGRSLCEAVRERDPDVPLTLLSAEEQFPGDLVNLSGLIASDAPADGLGELRLRPPDWCADNRITVERGGAAPLHDCCFAHQPRPSPTGGLSLA